MSNNPTREPKFSSISERSTPKKISSIDLPEVGKKCHYQNIVGTTPGVRQMRHKFEKLKRCAEDGGEGNCSYASPKKLRRGIKGNSLLIEAIRSSTDALLKKVITKPSGHQSVVLQSKQALLQKGVVSDKDIAAQLCRDAKHLSSVVRGGDGDLSLLVRDGEPVSSRLRSILTSSLLDPSPHRGLDPTPHRGYNRRVSSMSPHRRRGDAAPSPASLSSPSAAVFRTRSLGDVRPRHGPLTRCRGMCIRDSCTLEVRLCTLEEETRHLQQEVGRLEGLVAASRAEQSAATHQYEALTRQVGSEWQELHSREQRLQQLNASQSTLINKLSGKVRQYRARVRESDRRAEEAAERRVSAEQQSDELNSALSELQDKLHAAHMQHHFQLQLANDALKAERKKRQELEEQVLQVQQVAGSQVAGAEQLQRDAELTRQQLQQMQLHFTQREAQWKQEAKILGRASVAGHQKALSLRRQTGALRRALAEVRSLTRRDLSDLALDLARYSSSIGHACAVIHDGGVMASSSDVWARVQEGEKLLARTEAEKRDLRDKISDLNTRVSELSAALRDKELCILDLNRRVEEGATEAEAQEALRQKVRGLEAYLLDIAQCVLRDADTLRPDTIATAALAPSHAHALLRLSRDSSDGGAVAPDLPQSTVSAVRSALADRQLQIHELQLKLTSHKDQLGSLRKQYEAADGTAVALEASVGELREQLEAVARERDATAREKERVLEDLEALQGEKEALERAKAALKSECEAHVEECERRGRVVAELEAERGAWHEERQHVHAKFCKERDDVAKHAHTIAVLHTELASVKQQVSLLSDSVGKLRASEERLEEGREDLMEQVRRLERTRTELETQLAVAQRQEAEMRHTLNKVEEYNLSLGQDKAALQQKAALLEAERATAATERAELRAEVERLQDLLAAADEDKAALEASLVRAGERTNLVAIEKEKAELELNDALSERNELHAHAAALERSRNALEDELSAASAALTERDKTLTALTGEKEALSRRLAELELNKLQRELDGELNRVREAKSLLERQLDEHNTEHKKSMTALKEEYEHKNEALRREKVGV
ncbi:centrosome-associated protein CEP250-like [Hyalella azteca]|uniref:Centrosome-associated protein CEP250-like n=1 Tax=Hyalella azteca TaxID=294128 RepID=A0A979FMR3_HYAAZ|nr:centrosome-associated protein CEP250-like [Hyalella azteca]